MASRKNIFDRVKERRSCSNQAESQGLGQLGQGGMFTCKFCDNLYFSDITTLETHLVNYHQIVNHKMTNYFQFDLPVVGSELVEKYLAEKVTMMTKMNERVAELKRSGAMEDIENEEIPEKKAKQGQNSKNSQNMKGKLKAKETFKKNASHLKKGKPKKTYDNVTCHFCNKSYCNRSTLNRHLRTAHDYEPYTPQDLTPIDETVPAKENNHRLKGKLKAKNKLKKSSHLKGKPKKKHGTEETDMLCPSSDICYKLYCNKSKQKRHPRTAHKFEPYTPPDLSPTTSKKKKSSSMKKQEHAKISAKLSSKKTNPFLAKKFKSLSKNKSKHVKSTMNSPKTSDFKNSRQSGPETSDSENGRRTSSKASDSKNVRQSGPETSNSKNGLQSSPETSNFQNGLPISDGSNDKQCNVCGRVFFDKSTKIRHQITIHKMKARDNSPKQKSREEGRTCNMCQKSFYDKSTMNRHMFKAHKTQITPSDKDSLKDSPGGKCTKELCRKFINDKDKLKQHLGKYHTIKETTNANTSPSKIHMQKCQFDETRPHTKPNLSKQKRAYLNLLPEIRNDAFTCDKMCIFCKKIFRDMSSVNRHLRQIHGIQNRTEAVKIKKYYMCNVCQIVMTSKKERNLHKKLQDCKPKGAGIKRKPSGGEASCASLPHDINNNNNNNNNTDLFYDEDSREKDTGNLSLDSDNEGLSFDGDPTETDTRNLLNEASNEGQYLRDNSSLPQHEDKNKGPSLGDDQRGSISLPPFEVNNVGISYPKSIPQEFRSKGQSFGVVRSLSPPAFDNEGFSHDSLENVSPSSSLKSLTNSEQEGLMSYFKLDEGGSTINALDSPGASQKSNVSDLNLERCKESSQSSEECSQDISSKGNTSEEFESPSDVGGSRPTNDTLDSPDASQQNTDSDSNIEQCKKSSQSSEECSQDISNQGNTSEEFESPSDVGGSRPTNDTLDSPDASQKNTDSDSNIEQCKKSSQSSEECSQDISNQGNTSEEFESPSDVGGSRPTNDTLDSPDASQKNTDSDSNIEQCKKSSQSSEECSQDISNQGNTSEEFESPLDVDNISGSESSTSDSENSLEGKGGNIPDMHCGTSVSEQNVSDSNNNINKNSVILIENYDDKDVAEIKKVEDEGMKDIKVEFDDENHNESQYLEEFPVHSSGCSDTQSDSVNGNSPGNSEVVDPHTQIRERTNGDGSDLVVESEGGSDSEGHVNLDDLVVESEGGDSGGQSVDGKNCGYGREMMEDHPSLQESEHIGRDRKTVDETDIDIVGDGAPCPCDNESYSEIDCSSRSSQSDNDVENLLGEENVNSPGCDSNGKFKLMSKTDYIQKFKDTGLSKRSFEEMQESDNGDKVGSREDKRFEHDKGLPYSCEITTTNVGEYSAITESDNIVKVLRKDEEKENRVNREQCHEGCAKYMSDSKLEGTQESEDMDENIIALMDEMLAEKSMTYSPFKFNLLNNAQKASTGVSTHREDCQNANVLLFSQQHASQHRQVVDVNSDPNLDATFVANNLLQRL